MPARLARFLRQVTVNLTVDSTVERDRIIRRARSAADDFFRRNLRWGHTWATRKIAAAIAKTKAA